MSHVIIILTRQAVEAKSSTPPTAAQQALIDALTDADIYVHSSGADPGISADIEAFAETIIKPYVDAVTPLQDNRLQSYANSLNALIP